MSIPVLIHLGFALVATILVPLAILARRLGLNHRIMGRAAAAALFGTAASALFLTKHGVTPLHLLALMMMVTVTRAVMAARQGRIKAHRIPMMFCAASLVIAGVAAAAVPGRLLHRVLFG